MSSRRDSRTPLWPPPDPTSRCWKLPYPNEHEANQARRLISRRDPKRARALHAYLCNGCGKWHLGSKGYDKRARRE